MAEGSGRPACTPSRRPRRFRRRLTAAFVLVSALSAGALALVTYTVSSNYRWRNFEQSSEAEANIALALAPRVLDDSTFDRYIRASELRTGAETVAVAAGREYSTSEAITAEAIVAGTPGGIPNGPAGAMTGQEVVLNGKNFYLFASVGPSDVRYLFLFPLEQVEVGLAELRSVLAVSWVTIVAVSLGAGALVARRTLRPVREAADAATAIAGGSLDTRLRWGGDDEFSAWADSFNQMADALESRISELANAAERERRFTADAAHDLRTPLTGLSMTGSLLRERLNELPPDMHRVVELHTRDLERLRTLVLELLELHRIDAGREPVNVETLDVGLAVAATIDALRLPEGATIDLDVQPGLCVRAERVRFKRILGNVIINGASHGGGSIAIRAHSRPDDVAIEIEDDGEGISPEHIDAIFDRFFKSDASRAHGGSGLGLAIARENARLQGGDLTVHNRAGRGARFTLTLPRSAP